MDFRIFIGVPKVFDPLLAQARREQRRKLMFSQGAGHHQTLDIQSDLWNMKVSKDQRIRMLEKRVLNKD